MLQTDHNIAVQKSARLAGASLSRIAQLFHVSMISNGISEGKQYLVRKGSCVVNIDGDIKF